MILRTERRARAGFTLFEALIALAIISLVAGLVLATNTGPSARLRLEAEISRLAEDASIHRARAVALATDVVWAPTAATCDGPPIKASFFADGTAEASDICLTLGGEEARLTLDPVSGRLRHRIAP